MLLKLQSIVLIIMMSLLLLSGACKKAPDVTHAITDRSDASCLICHQGGANGAPVTAHTKYKDCLRCHKEVATDKSGSDKENQEGR
jgi:hypothetical protein